ncbi:M24 family metallopeptidase [Nitratireductor rhodophyticola]
MVQRIEQSGRADNLDQMKIQEETLDMNETEYLKKRMDQVQATLAKAGVDVAFFTSLRSLTYVGNIYQSLAWYVNTAIVYPASGDPMLVVPLSDRKRVIEETCIPRIETWNPPFAGIEERSFEGILEDFVRANKLERGTLGVEGNISWTLRSRLATTFPEARFVFIDDLMQGLVEVKDPMEVKRMRKVGELCTIGFEAARDNVRPGMTENELAGIIELAVRKAGCTGYWVPNQVGTGETVLLDHYPSDRVIKDNHYVKAGVHATYKLYCGDICNVMSLRKPEPDYLKLCNAVEEASKRTIDMMRPGVRSNQLYAKFTDYMAEAGFPNSCDWYQGHGLGTAHQKPLISPHDETELKENMIIILNGLAQPKGMHSYINEVMLLINADGAELISHNPMGLVQL